MKELHGQVFPFENYSGCMAEPLSLRIDGLEFPIRSFGAVFPDNKREQTSKSFLNYRSWAIISCHPLGVGSGSGL